MYNAVCYSLSNTSRKDSGYPKAALVQVDRRIKIIVNDYHTILLLIPTIPYSSNTPNLTFQAMMLKIMPHYSPINENAWWKCVKQVM